ncbi:beta-barrel assembly-enhancing protease [Desulfovibrio psychrotolerans]|uniref:Peptidase M48 domain-containing protein n=1 Tax=Desulfovibrio psychrotolerans TaxID=415242 RepID=A0A7J0BXF7_9BACT|nr:M48 family metallopeptidase [Desulfovibrio psychrotolerans]GFM38378.1 hypothetical protein DSM19430T_30620 [Desulfovibrio psychrotolerans]
MNKPSAGTVSAARRTALGFCARRCGRLLLCLTLVCATLLMPVQSGNADIRDLFGDFTLKDEMELGRKFSVLIKSRMPIIEDPEVVNYIAEIIDRLKASMRPHPYTFEASVLLDNSMNAFAVPGGYLFINTGMLLNLENESDLAGILAHELAHITQQHIASRLAKAKKTQLLGLAGALAGILLGGDSNMQGGLAVGSIAAAQTAMLNYSRQDERDADQMGLIYLVGGGYPPQGMLGGFEAIRKRRWQMGSTMPAYLSTHPDIDERLQYLSDRIRALPEEIRARTEDNSRFRRIQTLIRARYTDPKVALLHFDNTDTQQDCISLMGRGITLSRLNRVTEAADSFERALTCGPRDHLISREAGTFHYLKGDLNRAGSLLQKAILLNPRDFMAFFYYARLLGDKGDINGAANYFEEMLVHLPEDPEIHYYYGRLLGQNRRLFKAHLHLAYSALYKNDKKKTQYHLGLARSNAATPEDKEALERFDLRHAERAEFWNKD